MKRANSGGDFIKLNPHGWAILLVVVLPGTAFYFHRNMLALVLLAIGITYGALVASLFSQVKEQKYLLKALVKSKLGWKLTVLYALLFLATLISYYTRTLHLLFEPLGWELTALGQRGNWTPTVWPLLFAGVCLVAIGTALSVWPQAKGQAWRTLLQETTIRSTLHLLWLITTTYIVGRAMSALYSPMIVYATAIVLPLAILLLSIINIDLLTPIQTIGSVMRLLLALLAVPLYFLLFLFTKFGDLLLSLYIRFVRPTVVWFDQLGNRLTLQIGMLKRYREWLIDTIFDPSRDDPFKGDQDIRELDDAKLLG